MATWWVYNIVQRPLPRSETVLPPRKETPYRLDPGPSLLQPRGGPESASRLCGFGGSAPSRTDGIVQYVGSRVSLPSRAMPPRALESADLPSPSLFLLWPVCTPPAYAIVCPWTSGSFPPLGCRERCCPERSWTRICLSPSSVLGSLCWEQERWVTCGSVSNTRREPLSGSRSPLQGPGRCLWECLHGVRGVPVRGVG